MRWGCDRPVHLQRSMYGARSLGAGGGAEGDTQGARSCWPTLHRLGGAGAAEPDLAHGHGLTLAAVTAGTRCVALPASSGLHLTIKATVGNITVQCCFYGKLQVMHRHESLPTSGCLLTFKCLIVHFGWASSATITRVVCTGMALVIMVGSAYSRALSYMR